MNYDLRREYRWLVHDERYHATLWDCHGYIPRSGWKSARPEFYYVHIISCIHTACRNAATKLSVLSLVLRTVRSAGRLAGKQNWFPFERVDREERKKKKKENLFLFQLSIWKLDTRRTLFLLSITIAKRRRRWRRHFFTVDGRHTRCCCRKSLETTLEDGRALFRPMRLKYFRHPWKTVSGKIA